MQSASVYLNLLNYHWYIFKILIQRTRLLERLIQTLNQTYHYMVVKMWNIDIIK